MAYLDTKAFYLFVEKLPQGPVTVPELPARPPVPPGGAGSGMSGGAAAGTAVGLAWFYWLVTTSIKFAVEDSWSLYSRRYVNNWTLACGRYGQHYRRANINCTALGSAYSLPNGTDTLKNTNAYDIRDIPSGGSGYWVIIYDFEKKRGAYNDYNLVGVIKPPSGSVAPIHEGFWRFGSRSRVSTSPQSVLMPKPLEWRADANLMRSLPSLPFDAPAPAIEPADFTAIAATRPLRTRSASFVRPWVSPGVSPRPRPRPRPDTPPYQPPGFIPPVNPAGRNPPRKGEKERKARGTRTLSYRIFKALDRMSEASEIVDCLYDALPDDVKRRWGRDRPKRGMIDSAGQYGIDGADWKLQALWHNWHKVDLHQAAANIVKNKVQDQLHGAIHKRLPRNTGGALDSGLGAVDQAYSWLVDQL